MYAKVQNELVQASLASYGELLQLLPSFVNVHSSAVNLVPEKSPSGTRSVAPMRVRKLKACK